MIAHTVTPHEHARVTPSQRPAGIVGLMLASTSMPLFFPPVPVRRAKTHPVCPWVRRPRAAQLALLLAAVLPAAGTATRAPERECSQLPYDTLAGWASRAPVRENLTGGYRVLPGGATARLEIPTGVPAGQRWCARLQHRDLLARVLSASTRGPSDSAVTTLTLAVPDYGFGWYRSTELVLVAFSVDSTTGAVAPSVSVTSRMRVSNRWLAWLAALLVVGVTYLLAALTLGRLRDVKSWDPVRLTAGAQGHPSLSQFQILVFTLIVVFLLASVLVRTGLLTDISSDLLLLLGISGGGAAGAKVAGVMKKRLSLETWSWLRNAEWLTSYERGLQSPRSLPPVRWSDLLKTGDDFDVYSFQLATVSLLVAMALLSTELAELATFSLPQNVLALLGLSNVVYIGGKAVAPNSISELDTKVEQVRGLEKTWRDAVPPQATLQEATAQAPGEYKAYLAAALEAARMLKSIYGSEGTKFKDEPIRKDQVLPTFG